MGDTAAFQTAAEIIAIRKKKKYFVFQEHQKKNKDGYLQYRNTKIMFLIRTALYVSVTGHQDMRKKLIMENKDQIMHPQYSNMCPPVQLHYLLTSEDYKKNLQALQEHSCKTKLMLSARRISFDHSNFLSPTLINFLLVITQQY